MPGAAISEDAVDRTVAAAIDGARARHEQVTSTIVLVGALLATVAVVWRILAVEASYGYEVLALVGGIAGYYGWIVVAGRLHPRKAPTPTERFFRTTLEVSAPTLVMLLDTRVSVSFGLHSAAGYVIPLVIAFSTLRLDPYTPIYAASLAILEQLALYAWVYASIPPDDASLQPVLIWYRFAVMALSGLVGWRVARTLREKTEEVARETLREERVRTAFGSYVDQRVVEKVLAGDLRLEPERRVVTVMFVDIREFTRFSEKTDPVDLFRLLDEVLDRFSTEVQKQGGIVNKFLGDGLMAIFGAPEAQEDHCRRAVRAALNISGVTREFRESGRFPEMRIGIGLHSGEVIIGDLGNARREFTAIGDVVNVASRVEGANKELGTTILVTEPVLSNLGSGAEIGVKPALSIRGKTAPVQVYEVTRMELTGERPVRPG